ncbi:MAG: hypothetical protein OER82_05465 [Nitrosopumilus sp.]|nr:hypothetical protein [Nitrosopumilus sp.]
MVVDFIKLKEKLKEIQQLKKEGLITTEQFEKLRHRILDIE